MVFLGSLPKTFGRKTAGCNHYLLIYWLLAYLDITHTKAITLMKFCTQMSSSQSEAASDALHM